MYKYGQQEQVTVRNHNRSTALERSVLKYVGGGWWCLNRFYGIPTPFANTDIYESSFFPPPQSIRDWNPLTDSLLSAAEGAEDSVATFTSLVRARD